MLPYNPYTNSKGLFNPAVMAMRAPPAPAQQMSAPKVNHLRRSKAQVCPEPSQGPSCGKRHAEMAPGGTSPLGPLARKKSRLEELDTTNKEASAAGTTNILKHRIDIQNVPSSVLLNVFRWQVKGENTAGTVRELSSLVLVSKEFRTLFHPELIREGIRHAVRTKNHDLLKDLSPKAHTLNFPASTSCEARNASLPSIGAPLHESAGADDALGVAILLSAGADPNFLDCRHETALHRAAKSASSLVFVQLVKAGGNRGLRNLHLWTPFDIAIANKNFGVIYTLWRLGQRVDGLNDPTGSSPVHKAIDTNCLATLQLVLAFRPKLNVKDWSGATPLIYAIRQGKRPEAVEMIIRLGPNALAEDRAGKTALFYTQVRRDVAVRDLFARYFWGPAFNKGLKDAQRKCYRRYETTPREFSFIYHY